MHYNHLIRWIQLKCNQKFKQVCIPVGCVPPACCPYLPACTVPGGLVWGGLPSGGGLLRGGGSAPGGILHGMGQTPPEQNSWHTFLKILPYSNFIVGGKNTNMYCNPRLVQLILIESHLRLQTQLKLHQSRGTPVMEEWVSVWSSVSESESCTQRD